ncbi:MAG: GxxExxY protein [Chitinivibrionales bacterium]|nr:GxxExxY protein [Chitinivibrionales bacterium]
MENFPFKDETFKINGACFEVYNEMGSGFLESVYQESLEIEFENQSIPYISQPEIRIKFKKRELKSKYKPDFLCYDRIVVELKSVSKLTDEHRAQILNYLKATNMKIGLLINFGHFPKLEYERFIL